MLRPILSIRLPAKAPEGARWWVWAGLSLVLVVFAPAQLWEHVPLWTLGLRGVGQNLVTAIAFLGLAWFLAMAANHPGGLLIKGLVAAVVWYGAASWVLNSRLDLMFSQGELLIAAGLGTVLAFLPYLLSGWYGTLGRAALAAAVGVVWLMGRQTSVAGSAQQRTILSSLKPFSVSIYDVVAEPISVGTGGAIEAYGKSVLLVTGDGAFYVLDWDAERRPHSRKLALSLPADRLTPRQQERLDAVRMGPHRITDMVVDTANVPAKVYVSYQHWNPTDECFSVRVSAADVESPSAGVAGEPWTQIFETWPCIPPSTRLAWLEAGGRLAWQAGKLLLTVGDFNLSQTMSPPLSQDPATAYGKVHILDRSGQHEVFTIGHRNPQGLFVDRDQKIWLTEHGPQGGDEINLLQKGRNYGHPYFTYGTSYGRHYWPLAPTAHDHGDYTEPVHAFVPSIGISNLIRVASNLFPEWQNDLLVASLNGRSLYRVRLRDERAIYVEPLWIGSRIRDITEAPDGHILLWTGARVFVLAPGQSQPNAREAFVRCQNCHETAPGAEPLGPSLRGIVGSSVARDSQFPYSPALRSAGGNWTEDRLDAFLKDPNAFAPGSTMPGEVADETERRLLIDQLKRYR